MKLSILFCLAPFLLLIQGCGKSEGCTDEKAYNYDITAVKNDGSCKYCEASEETHQVEVFLYDEHPESIYYFEYIARVDIVQTIVSYNNTNCSLDQCSFEATVTNLTEHHIENFQFLVELHLQGFEYHFGTDGAITLPINSSSTIEQNSTATSCISIAQGFTNSNVMTAFYSN